MLIHELGKQPLCVCLPAATLFRCEPAGRFRVWFARGNSVGAHDASLR